MRIDLRAAWRRLAGLWSELAYAQSRVLELRTGLTLTPETERRRRRAQIGRLEELLAHPGEPDAVDADMDALEDSADRDERAEREEKAERQ